MLSFSTVQEETSTVIYYVGIEFKHVTSQHPDGWTTGPSMEGMELYHHIVVSPHSFLASNGRKPTMLLWYNNLEPEEIHSTINQSLARLKSSFSLKKNKDILDTTEQRRSDCCQDEGYQ